QGEGEHFQGAGVIRTLCEHLPTTCLGGRGIPGLQEPLRGERQGITTWISGKHRVWHRERSQQEITIRSKEKGSSPNSGECCPNLEEEVIVVAKAIGHALDDLDLVVDTLEQAGIERIAAVGQYTGQVQAQSPGKRLQRGDAATDRAARPARPEASGVALVPIVPQRLQIILQDIT